MWPCLNLSDAALGDSKVGVRSQSQRNEGVGRRRVAPRVACENSPPCRGETGEVLGDGGGVAGQATNQASQQLSDEVGELPVAAA